jgi:hypothetical protein
MRQHKSNQDSLILVVNFSDKTIFIPTNVKDCAFPKWVSMWEHSPRISKILPLRSFGNAIPGIERFFCVRMLLPELSQFLPADDMHSENRPNLKLPKW